jgi:hypothetical protein
MVAVQIAAAQLAVDSVTGSSGTTGIGIVIGTCSSPGTAAAVQLAEAQMEIALVGEAQLVAAQVAAHNWRHHIWQRHNK